MNCAKPLIDFAGRAFGCGQCRFCRFNKRREWTHRILLESYSHADNAFLTLTYADERLELTNAGQPNLNPQHLREWLNRFRMHSSRKLGITGIRYFAVGEYGDQTERPHYHAALFGFPRCLRGRTPPDRRGLGSKCCPFCDAVRETWGLGAIELATLEPESAQYIAGYVVKKMTKADDERLDGRHPEFARMSRMPALGTDFVRKNVVPQYLHHGIKMIEPNLRHGNQEWPLGRTLTNKLIEDVYAYDPRDAKVFKAARKARHKIEMRPLLQAAQANRTTIEKEVLKQSEGKRASFDAKQKIRASRKRGKML